MESSRNKAKKVAKEFRQLAKRFFEDFYTRAAKAGRHPLPLEAMVALVRIISQAAAEYQELPEPLPHLQLPKYAFQDLLDSNLFQQIYLDACNSYGRHTPGLDFKKGKPGRPINAEEVACIAKLLQSKSYREVAKETLPEGEPNTLRVESERERIRAVARRQRRRQSK